MRRTELYQSRRGTEIGLGSSAQAKVMIYAAGLVDSKRVDLSEGLDKLIQQLKDYGFKSRDLQFILAAAATKKPEQNNVEFFQSLKSSYIPKEALESIASDNNSRTKVLASFLKNEIKGILDDDDNNNLEKNKNGIRQIVRAILDSPERENMLLYMQAHLNKKKFLQFLSVCMDSKSLKQLHTKFSEVGRFNQLNDDKNLYSALSDEIRKGSRLTELLESNLKNRKFDSISTETIESSKKGFLEFLMIAPSNIAILTQLRGVNSPDRVRWEREAEERAARVVENIPKETKQKMSPEVILEMKNNHKKKYLAEKRRDAVLENQHEIHTLYKSLYLNYVPKEDRDKFAKEYDKSPLRALKYIRADRRFNPFMYARVFVDGLAQEYMNAIDKLTPGQGQEPSTRGATIAKGIITVFRTVFALPLRLLGDPAGVARSIGVTAKRLTSPLVARFRKWQVERGKSADLKILDYAMENLNKLEELFKSRNKLNYLNAKDFNQLNNFVNKNMMNFIKSGLVNTSQLGKEIQRPEISELIKKVAQAASSHDVKFTQSEISLLFEHMEKQAKLIKTDFTNGDYNAMSAIKLITEHSTSLRDNQKMLNKVSGVPSLNLSSLNGRNSAQQIEAVFESARSPRSPDSFSSSDHQSPHDTSSSMSSPHSSSDAMILANIAKGESFNGEDTAEKDTSVSEDLPTPKGSAAEYRASALAEETSAEEEGDDEEKESESGGTFPPPGQ